MPNKFTINSEIKKAEAKVEKARNEMFEKGINTERINSYNKELIILGDLQTKHKHLNKKQKPMQYMEEIPLNGIILT